MEAAIRNRGRQVIPTDIPGLLKLIYGQLLQCIMHSAMHSVVTAILSQGSAPTVKRQLKLNSSGG